MIQEPYDLQELSQAALEVRGGRIAAMNDAARAQLPQLAAGAPVPAALARSLENAESAGTFDDGEESFLFARAASSGGDLILFRPARGCGVTGAQLDGFSRQMRDQLGGLLNQMDLLSGQLQAPGETGLHLARVNQSFHQMLRLVSNLEFLNIPPEQVQAQFQPVAMDVAGLCAQLARQAAPLLRKAGVELHYESPCTGLLIPGDPELLQRMLLDLISNAAKAAPGGAVYLTLRPWRGRAVLSVSDSGEGGEQGLEALLQEAGETIPGPGEGAGMGLDVVRRIARLHGAALLTRQNGGGGLIFTVSLPTGPLPAGLSLNTPKAEENGGLSPFLVELADLLPAELFLPDPD